MEALRVQAEQHHALQSVVAIMAQASGKPKDKGWNDTTHFHNVRLFGGDAKEWDEFSVKLKGHIAAGNTKVADIVDFMEAKVAESELEKEDYSAIGRGRVRCIICCSTSRPEKRTQW